MPHDLSPRAMVAAADGVVQGVFAVLGLASLLTWTVFLAKSWAIVAAGRRARAALGVALAARSLAEAAAMAERLAPGPGRAMLRAAADEAALPTGGAGLKERVASHLGRIEAAGVRALGQGTGVLATIGATAPFVGLFGTVWGIMNAFIGISRAQTTTLAIVAPGIAEALLATAAGLVAAIPAVVIYNAFARAIAGHRGRLADIAAAVQRLVSRDLDRPGGRVLAQAAE